MAADDSFLYDSIEVDRSENTGGYVAGPTYDPRVGNRGGYGQQFQHPGVSDSFDYHYVDTNGHSLQASTDFNPMQNNGSQQWDYNAQNYHGYQHDATMGYQSYGTNNVGYMDQGGDTSMYYDSIDATANYYEPYSYSNGRYVDANSEYEHPDRYYDPNANGSYQNNPNPLAESIVRDSLEVGNDMSRYEDVDASYNENYGKRSKHYDRKSTVDESTMSFMSHASHGLMSPGADDKPFFNPDVEAHQHAINIQSSWRGHDTRKEYKKSSNVVAPKAPGVSDSPSVAEAPSNRNKHDYDHHATVIQSNYRGYRVRKKNKASSQGKESQTTKKSGFVQNEDEAATAIQSSFRGYKSRKDYNEKQKGPRQTHGFQDDEKMRNENATVIQSNYRRYKARKDLKSRKENTDEDDATNIQSALKGRESRKRYELEKQQNQSATVIQANYRGYKTRKELEGKRKKPQKEVSEVDFDEHAEKIQGVVRGRKTRNDHMRAKKENESAVVIQSNYRGYRTRKQMKESKSNLNDDATRLQGALRGRNAREAHAKAKEEDEDASQIQAVVRGRAIRLEHAKQKEENESATLIQANYRGYQARKNLKGRLDDEEAATSIQGALRGREARKEYEAVKLENTGIAANVHSDDDNDDATIIQGALQGRNARNEFDKTKEREENAAVIQAGYRGYKARKELQNSSHVLGNQNVPAGPEVKNTGQKSVKSRKSSFESGKKINEEKSLEAAWDRNREMARRREVSSNTQPKGKGPGNIGQRKYTEYLEHNKWAQRQDKRRAGEPVSRLPTMAAGSSAVHIGNVNKKETAPRPTQSKNSNVSFSDPYNEHEGRNYPKSPLPPATAEYSDVSSVTSEEDSIVQKMERERLRSQLLQEEKKQKPRKPGEAHNKESLQTEIMNGKRERKRDDNNEERDRVQKSKHEKYNKPKPRQMVRNYSSETLDSAQEDNESLYEFDPKPKRIQEYKLKGYRRKGKWIKPRQQSDDDEMNSMEDETSEDYETEPMPPPPHGHGHPYAHVPYGYPYGMPQYPFPMQNGMGMPEPPHVAFVPVPWNSMHPLEQTLLASQLGPAMQMPAPPVAPTVDASTSVPREKEDRMASKQIKPKVAPGKDFVEKNKAKAVTREQEKASYKQIAMKQAKKNVDYSDESFQEIPVKQEMPKVAAKKKAPAEMIATKTSINDGGTVKVDINLNIPPEQLAAMLGLDPRKIGIDSNTGNARSSMRNDPSPTKDRSPVKDRSPIRNVNENPQVTHRMNKPPNAAQNASPSRRRAEQGADQDKGNIIRNEKGLPTKPKEPNPYKKIPPISTNNAKPDKHRKDRSVSPKGMPQHRPVFYKPYTLDDYKALNLDIKLPVHLGPEHEKIEEKRKAKDRQESYAKHVREQNMIYMQTTNKFDKPNDVQTKLSRRKVGIEYSKSVPRPKQVKNDDSDEESAPPMNEQMQRIEELKRRHEQDKNAVAKT